MIPRLPQYAEARALQYLRTNRGKEFTTGNLTEHLKRSVRDVPHPTTLGLWLSRRCINRGHIDGHKRGTVWLYPKE